MLDDKDWNNIFGRIKSGECIPFLGAGACSPPFPLGKDIAKKWAEKYRYPLQDSDLIKVAQYMDVINENPKQLMVDEIKKHLEGVKSQDTKFPEIYDILADLPLKVYITTNYDDLIIKALIDHEKRPKIVHCPWYMPIIPALLDFSPTSKNPVVFYLHGFYEKPESLVLTEKDYVEMLVRISTDRDKLFPEWIRKELKDASLLFLGYSMEDWDFKVLFESLVNKVAPRSTKKRVHVSVQRPKKQEEKEYLELYFKNLNTQIYWDGCIQFISDFKEKWKNYLATGDSATPPTPPTPSIQPDKLQYYPGNTSVAKNRRKHMVNDLEKMRDISDDDLTSILGHRAPGYDFPSTHPPLAEMGEPDCPIREVVEATPGAAAGDRVRYIQFADSMYNAPATPYWRSYHAAINFRGVDPGTLSGRQVVEMRERDLEEFSKRVCETEITDWGLAGMRGCTVHGHSLRLQEDGTMFDMLDRRRLEGGVIIMDKDQVGIPLDRKVNLGKPISEAEAAKRTTIYRVDNVPFRSDKEVIEHVQRVWELRTKYGFQPKA